MASKLTTYSIRFHDKSYVCAYIPGEILDWDECEVCIACESLNDVLYDEEKGYPDYEAQKLDETIWGFLPDEDFQLSYREFSQKVRQNLY